MTRTAPATAATPRAAGVDARGVLALVDALERHPGVEPHSLVLRRHGRQVAAGWWSPYAADRPHLLYSLSKSFTAAAVGLAEAEGRLSRDDLVLDHLPELAPHVTDPRRRALRIRHLLAMATGDEADTWAPAKEADPEDPVRGFFGLTPAAAPGTLFAYNQPATFTLGTIVQRLTGGSLTDYLRPRLLDPIGAAPTAWSTWHDGRDMAFTGMFATTDTIARFGQLYLDDGVWEGRRLLPADWVAEATRVQVATTAQPNPDWRQGYGFQFWMSQHGFRGDGAFGQFCIVLPGLRTVVAMTAATVGMQAVLDAVWAHLLPALHDAPLTGADAEAADAALAERLARLALPDAPAARNTLPALTGWADRTFTPEGGSSRAQPTLSAVRVRLDGDGRGHLVLHDADDVVTADVVAGPGWTVTDAPLPAAGGTLPLAVAGGWPDADTLRLEVRLLETPHRLVLTCSRPKRTFRSRWPTLPLDPRPLHELRMPR